MGERGRGDHCGDGGAQRGRTAAAAPGPCVSRRLDRARLGSLYVGRIGLRDRVPRGARISACSRRVGRAGSWTPVGWYVYWSHRGLGGSCSSCIPPRSRGRGRSCRRSATTAGGGSIALDRRLSAWRAFAPSPRTGRAAFGYEIFHIPAMRMSPDAAGGRQDRRRYVALSRRRASVRRHRRLRIAVMAHVRQAPRRRAGRHDRDCAVGCSFATAASSTSRT